MGVLLGGSAPSSAVVSNIYNISADGVPNGGALAGGAAPYGEHIPYTPVGGAVAGGSAIAAEVIPFKPAGGATAVGASAPSTVAYSPPVAGGGIAGGSAANAAVYAQAPSGGILAGGAATITALLGWYTPVGGAVAGGAALTYAFLAGFTPTAENPYGDAFPGWALNFETGAPSRYLGMPANSFTQLNGVTYVANAGGVYSLDAKSDAGQPIHASFLLPNSDYGSKHNKRLPSVWFGLKSSAAMVFKVVTDNANQRFTSSVPAAPTMRTLRVKLAKGIEGRYFKAGLANVAGADFELESMELPFTELRRHGR